MLEKRGTSSKACAKECQGRKPLLHLLETQTEAFFQKDTTSPQARTPVVALHKKSVPTIIGIRVQRVLGVGECHAMDHVEQGAVTATTLEVVIT